VEGLKASALAGLALRGVKNASNFAWCVGAAMAIGKAIDRTLKPANYEIGGIVAVGLDESCATVLMAALITRDEGRK
jgi:hypothetical protein